MKNVNHKILVGLCVLFFAAAAGEGVLLYKAYSAHKARQAYLNQSRDSLSDPPFPPFSWNTFTNGFDDWNDKPLLNAATNAERLMNRQLRLNEPKRVDTGSEVQFIFDIKGHDKAQFEVNVANRQLTFTGKDEHKTINPKDSGAKQSSIQKETTWSETQSMTLPGDVDPKNYVIKRSGDSFTVIFHKVGTTANSSGKDKTSS